MVSCPQAKPGEPQHGLVPPPAAVVRVLTKHPSSLGPGDLLLQKERNLEDYLGGSLSQRGQNLPAVKPGARSPEQLVPRMLKVLAPSKNFF